MPMYEYLCDKCQKSHDKIYPRWQDAVERVPCPVCGGMSEKQLSKGSFVMLDEFGDSVSVSKS